MNNSITLKQLAVNPILAYSINIPKPEDLKITPYEQQAYPAIFGNLTGVSISRVSPMYKMGRVMSFDLVPKSNPDPVIIFSPIGDLKQYYSVWAEVVTNENGGGYWMKGKIKRYDSAIKTFVESSYGLALHEITFAIIEMLKFKNDVMLA